MDATSARIHRIHDLMRAESILRYTRTDGTRVLRETISEARETHPHIAREKLAVTCRRWRQALDTTEQILADMP